VAFLQIVSRPYLFLARPLTDDFCQSALKAVAVAHGFQGTEQMGSTLLPQSSASCGHSLREVHLSETRSCRDRNLHPGVWDWPEVAAAVQPEEHLLSDVCSLGEAVWESAEGLFERLVH
jgi:hypothetical protein